ncbi:hypothetical protein HYX00_04640, partial [Candidatus Woesearchaeota archaeon]|nr:hypothetical protein [Candidatus Woesearchaeota archaeon]
MNPEEEEDVSIDLSKIKKFFTSDKKEGSKTGETKESSSPEKQDQEDEEITIDFSKIKSFFKSDKKEEKKAEEATKESSGEGKDDEISIDFSKIKNFFKSDEKEERPSKEIKKDDEDIEFSFDLTKIKKIFKSDEKESAGSDEEVSVDWSRIIDFFKKYGVVFIALIPIILSIYIRMQAGSLPFTDRWAIDTVINGIRSQVSGEINQQYPNLPDANKNALVEAKLQQVISQNKKQIDDTIRAYSNSFKSFFQDENGKNYMPDIDPYYWVRYASNIIKNGHPGDVLKDGKPFDNLQLAPNGRFVFPDMLPSYSMAYFYKFLHFFASELTLMRSAFYLTIFISALCVLLVFLIGRKIAGNIGGFFAALMMAINGAFLSRSLHPDNDIWVIFFPLLVTWLFVSTIDVKNTFKIIIISSIAGFFTGLFIFAWSGWWYIFDFLLVTGGVTFFYLVLINFNEIRKNTRLLFSNIAIRDILVFSIVYFISTAAFVVIFSGLPTFRNSFLGPLSFPSIKAPVGGSSWPNVLTTVAE